MPKKSARERRESTSGKVAAQPLSCHCFGGAVADINFTYDYKPY